MNVFIWKDTDYMTTRYHNSGGAVAIAESLDEAREMFNQRKKVEGLGDAVFTIPPDITINCSDTDVEKQVFVFPDAGCC